MITQTRRFHLTSLSAISEESLKSLEETSESLCITEQQRDRDHANWNAWINGERQPDHPWKATRCRCWDKTYGEPGEDWLHSQGECRCRCSYCQATRLEHEIIHCHLDRDALRDSICEASNLRYPVSDASHDWECTCPGCLLDAAETRIVHGLNMWASTAGPALRELEKAEREAWLESEEGRAWTAQQAAERRAREAEYQARKETEAEDFGQFLEGIRQRGPLNGAIRGTGDAAGDLMAFLAACSVPDPDADHYGQLFVRQLTGRGKQLARYESGLVEHESQLVELRAGPCPLHQDEVREAQREDPSLSDWDLCDSGCPVRAEIWPITTGKRLGAYVHRRQADGLSVSEWIRPDKHDGHPAWFAGARWSGYRWQVTSAYDDPQLFTEYVTDCNFPGIKMLLDVVQLPGILRLDGSIVTQTGYDSASQLWVQPASAPGRREIGSGPSLAAQLAVLAQRHGGRWDGGTAELAAQIDWPRSARALTSALNNSANRREMRVVGVAAFQEGWTRSRVRNWTVILKNPVTTSDTPELCR
jgi:hypothetical protein